MATDEVYELINDALGDRSLRIRLSQDRSPAEMVESAARTGYEISKKDARKILASALLTSDSLSQENREALVGGLKWDYLDRVVAALDGDYRLLEDRDTWDRARDFFEYVYRGES